jgi:hypothetical protein
LHEFPVVSAIGGVEPVQATVLVQIGIGVFQEFPFPKIAELRWDNGWRQIHYSLSELGISIYTCTVSRTPSCAK